MRVAAFALTKEEESIISSTRLENTSLLPHPHALFFVVNAVSTGKSK